MAFDLNALAAYTQENEKELVLSTLFTPKTLDIIRKEGTVLTKVSTSIQLNELDTDAVFQAGGGCGFNASGTTAISRRLLTVGAIKVHESLCPKDLKTKYTQLLMSEGSQPETFPFEQKYTDRKVAKIGKQLEIAVWQGDTGSGNVNLNKFDGLVKIIDAAGLNVASTASPVAANAQKTTGTITSATNSTTVTGVGTKFLLEVSAGDKIYSGSVLIGTVTSVASDTSLTLTANAAAAVSGAAFVVVHATSKFIAAPILASAGITSSNVRSIMTGVWQSIPADVKGQDDVRIFCGWDVYETYIGALIDANLFAYTAESDKQKAGEIMIPGTMYKLTAVHGLNGTNRIYAMRSSNMALGTDMNEEEYKFELFFAKEADQVRFMAEWKTGVQVYFPNEVVQFLGA